jgi:hypothetical protein
LRREQSRSRRANTFARRKNLLAFAKITTPSPDEFAKIDIYIRDDLLAFAGDVFLHDDCVGAHWHRRTRENSNRFTRANAQLSV